MNRAQWLERIRESMIEGWSLAAESTEGGSTIRRDGLVAAVVPATPDRSVTNSVIYSDRGALLESLDELAGAYDEAGVRAWTVWVPEDDREAADALAEAGHVLDAAPRAMGLDLARLERPELGEVGIERGCGVELIGRINDEAYGYDPADGLGRVIASIPPERAYTYCASADGEPAAVLMALDCGDDVEVAWVATTDAARGRGLATALTRQSLWDGRERGRRTATLQATKLGTPVYARVGFEDFGALEMWERR